MFDVRRLYSRKQSCERRAVGARGYLQTVNMLYKLPTNLLINDLSYGNGREKLLVVVKIRSCNL